MNPLISLDNVSLAYGLDPLLDHVQLQLFKSERVCLIGRNGAGKSSLMKVVDGAILPDSGSVWRMPNLKIARLAQELPTQYEKTVYEFVSEGLAETGRLLADYYAITHRLGDHTKQSDLIALEKVQHQIDSMNGWLFDQTIQTTLTRLALDPDKPLSALSGGWQRRAALAQALVISPELLLLDEPTNHLDIEGIEWLEEQLLSSGCGLLFITHDRSLLKRLATRIIELDRGHLTSWPGDYDNFLRRKEEMLHAEAKQNADFDKKLAQEEVWIRQGIKARRTRNEGRVRALIAMRRERDKRREQMGKASFNINQGNLSGQLVVETSDVSHAFSDRKVIDHFSVRIMRGDRVGLIGPNGVGKSTLLAILLGQLQPNSGEVKLGTNLQVAYFDQQRIALDLNKTVIDNVAEGSEFIEINGERKHIISYLGDFLFTAERARTPVKALSGGECNRLMLAKLFSKPANLLVLDEPTNDLDIETLELLEELLGQYQGTLLIVSHDRAFLDNVVTSTLVFTGEGKIEEYVGGYQDYLAQRSEISRQPKASTKQTETKSAAEPVKSQKKLSYKEQRELEELPKKIEQLESQLAAIQQKMNDADFYKQDQAAIKETLSTLQSLEKEIEEAYLRWDTLEALSKSS